MGEHDHNHNHENDDQQIEREARRLVALSRIRQYGDAVLRMKAREVESFDDDLERLIERMKALMHEANGLGLAATQVGVSLTLPAGFVEVGEARSDWAPDPARPLPTFSPKRRVPHGVTLVGRLFEEGTLGRAGVALERAFGVSGARPPGF